MIYAYQVYETILDLARKDLRGRSLSPEEYNSTAKIVNELVYTKHYKDFEENIDNSDTLGGFKVFDVAIALAADAHNTCAFGSLPPNYYHIIGKPRYYDGYDTRWLDVVSTYEHAIRVEDYLTQATSIHPYCMIGDVDGGYTALRVYPYDIGTPVWIDYLRIVTTPYLDYYINDTTAEYTWIAAGTTPTVPLGSTYRDGHTGSYAVPTALTKNWEWSDSDFSLICNLFLQQMGIQLPAPELYEGGTLQEKREEA
jgi:hypothetical protein